MFPQTQCQKWLACKPHMSRTWGAQPSLKIGGFTPLSPLPMPMDLNHFGRLTSYTLSATTSNSLHTQVIVLHMCGSFLALPLLQTKNCLCIC